MRESAHSCRFVRTAGGQHPWERRRSAGRDGSPRSSYRSALAPPATLSLRLPCFTARLIVAALALMVVDLPRNGKDLLVQIDGAAMFADAQVKSA